MEKIFILLAFLTIGIISLMAQAPPPPPESATNSGTNGFVGGPAAPSAPVGSGTFILLALAAAYGGRKVYNMKAAESQE
jgi:hypothetical protein